MGNRGFNEVVGLKVFACDRLIKVTGGFGGLK